MATPTRTAPVTAPAAQQATIPGTGLSRTEIQSARERMQALSPTNALPDEAIIEGADASRFIQTSTPELAAAAALEADFIAPVFVKIEPGQTLTGVLEERGTHDFVDQKTGVVTTVATYTVSIGAGKMRGWFLGAYELDRALKVCPADGSHQITIFRGQDQRVGQNNVSRYRVMFKRVASPAAELVAASEG